MPVQITAKRDGFRRCGIAHREKTTTYPDDHFTADQLATLESEPMLVVVRVSDKQASGKDAVQDLAAAQARIVELETASKQAVADNDELKAELATVQGNLTAVTAERDALSAQLAASNPDKAKK
ncbi:HI1506-related protein [Brenneria populi subsp. brevivirga]|uniref:HI1506-related protein n=1 Tax=Brenneria populi TaxID=1505588 RepID=UPI002E196050|nr:HI1506-related protein [Brenneria populi subsp. brevivirga]